MYRITFASYGMSYRSRTDAPVRIGSTVATIVLCVYLAASAGATESVARIKPPTSKADIPDNVSGEIRGLVEKTFSDDPSERASAAKELRKFGSKSAPAVPFLIRLLGDESRQQPTPSSEAFETLYVLRDAAILPLTAGLAVDDENIRYFSISLLEMIGDRRAVPALIRLLDRDAGARGFSMRGAAASALGEIGDARAVEPLLGLLKDSDRDVVARAVSALGEIGDHRAIKPLLALLKSPQSDLRSWAAIALGRFGDWTLFDPLFTGLKNVSNSDERQRFLFALGGTKDPRAFGILRSAFQDNEGSTKRTAIRGLARLGDAHAIGLLESICSTAKLHVFQSYLWRNEAARALITTGNAGAINFVLNEFKVRGEIAPVRTVTNFTIVVSSELARSANPNAYLRAAEMLKDNDQSVRRNVASVLATGVDPEECDGGSTREQLVPLPALHDARVLALLMKVAADESEAKDICAYARQALEKSSKPEAVRLPENTRGSREQGKTALAS